MPKIRVLVVEDSLTVRKRIVEILVADHDLIVAGEAADGREAVDLCRRLRPDVVTLDIALPVMSGLAATEAIMAYCPTPILIVSASTNRGDLLKTCDALAAGAVDVLEKPQSTAVDGDWERALVARVKLVSRIRVITHVRARINQGPHLPAPVVRHDRGRRIAAIGASTGGPGACLEILKNLPQDFPVPILLVIHIDTTFGLALADWLDGLLPFSVRCARDGEPLPEWGRPGVVMAPPGRHLIVDRGRLRLSDGPARHSCRPSVDVLFESIAQDIGPEVVACLLTGMGTDGAQGLLAIRRAGGRTIVQDEATSVVFGMPQGAIRIGAAEQVLPLDRIAPALAALAGVVQERGR